MSGIFGISAYGQVTYRPGIQYGTSRNKAAGGSGIAGMPGNLYCSIASPYQPGSNDDEGMGANESWQVHKLVRDLNRLSNANDNPYAVSGDDRTNGFMELYGSSKSDKDAKELNKIKYNYSYKEVAGKIQRAKTSVSAEQAVISAKRKVVEVKRQIAAGNGDAEELQLALTHAKRMEMAARKKKHNLELEELVITTQSRDERADKQEEAAADMRDAIITAKEEEVSKAEDYIFDERQDMIEDAVEEIEESGSEVSDEAMAELNEMVAKFGEEELEELEEAMEALEDMEIIDPHMSKEDLEELKRKHRAAEQKAMLKADMDYLKGMIKNMSEKGPDIKGLGGNTSAVPTIAASVSGADFSMAGISVPEPSVDIQV